MSRARLPGHLGGRGERGEARQRAVRPGRLGERCPQTGCVQPSGVHARGVIVSPLPTAPKALRDLLAHDMLTRDL